VRFSLIAFDLDGTLVDSLADLAASANSLLESSGASRLDDDAIGRMVGEGAATLVRRAFAAAGVPQPEDALARFLEIYDRRLLECTRPYDGVPELLRELARRAIPLAVLTNKPLASTRAILDGLGLAQFFPADRVVGGDGPFPRKPDPASLRHLASISGAAQDRTLMIGDSVIDWRTARSAGSPVCLVRYGFGFRDFPRDQLGAETMTVEKPFGILELL
jgi:phosphoglycolate phosphatase